jgi:hypothetical protein
VTPWLMGLLLLAGGVALALHSQNPADPTLTFVNVGCWVSAMVVWMCYDRERSG